MNILLAEDSRTLAVALSGVLRAEGHEVDEVYDGMQALEKLNDKRYDCLIAESNLPRISGARIASEAKAKNIVQSVICLLSTSYYNGNDSYPFDMLLTKPFAVETLIGTLSRLETERGRETYGFVTLDFHRKELFYKGKAVNLTLPELETARILSKSKDPVAAYSITGAPLVDVEGGVFKTIGFINKKLKRANIGLKFVSDSDKGYRVCYD